MLDKVGSLVCGKGPLASLVHVDKKSLISNQRPPRPNSGITKLSAKSDLNMKTSVSESLSHFVGVSPPVNIFFGT